MPTVDIERKESKKSKRKRKVKKVRKDGETLRSISISLSTMDSYASVFKRSLFFLLWKLSSIQAIVAQSKVIKSSIFIAKVKL